MVIHVGFPKTATSTWQQNVFSRFEGALYLGMPFTDQKIESVCQDIQRLDSLCFDKKYPNSEFTQYLDSLCSTGKPVLLSNEVFTKREDGMAVPGVSDMGDVARRIRDAFGKAHIVLSIRKQEDCIPSFYLQYAYRYFRSGYLMKFNEYFRRHKQRGGRSIMADVDYWSIIEKYRHIFDPENVTVLVFEEFVSNPERYAKRMARVLDCESQQLLELINAPEKKVVNARVSQKSYLYMRFVSDFVPIKLRNLFQRIIPNRQQEKFRNAINRGPKANIQMNDEQVTFLHDLLSEGNRRIEQEYDIDLRQYGYTVKDT